MEGDLTADEMFRFLTSDFETLWDSIAQKPSLDIARGNFVFALLATVLLEWASRLCSADPSGAALEELSDALASLEPRYFMRLPADCPIPRQFALPTRGNPKREMISLVWDLIRNGQAHQYQQRTLKLPSGEFFGIALTGPAHGNYLQKLRDGLRPPAHVSLSRDGRDGELGWLRVDPAMLFIDVRWSVERSGLLRRGLSFPYLAPDPQYYQFTLDELESTFVS